MYLTSSLRVSTNTPFLYSSLLSSKSIYQFPERCITDTPLGSHLDIFCFVLDNMPPGDMTDAERRLYYVGMTRTKNRLIMCEGLDRDSEQLTLDQIIGKEWREKYQGANQKIAQ